MFETKGTVRPTRAAYFLENKALDGKRKPLEFTAADFTEMSHKVIWVFDPFKVAEMMILLAPWSDLYEQTKPNYVTDTVERLRNISDAVSKLKKRRKHARVNGDVCYLVENKTFKTHWGMFYRMTRSLSEEPLDLHFSLILPADMLFVKVGDKPLVYRQF